MVFTAPHSQDLRKGRFSEKNRVYLLTAVTWQRQPIFADFALGRLVVQAMQEVQAQGMVESLTFVVMPDHCHWLVTLQGEASLAQVMRSVKGRPD